MWGNTLVIDRICPSPLADELRGKEEDRLVLTWEERRWMRGRFTTERGRKIGIALQTGTIVAPGAILHVGADWYLKIEAAAEAVLETIPADCREAVKIAFEVGNHHYPLAYTNGRILVPDDKVMTRLMERLGVKCERRREIFDSVGGAPLHRHESVS